MIQPTKYMDLNICVLNVAAHIIELLREPEIMGYDGVLARVQRRTSDLARFDFILALDFLYLTGVIDYLDEGDSVVLLRSRDRQVCANEA